MRLFQRKRWLARLAAAIRIWLVALLLAGPGGSSLDLLRDTGEFVGPVTAGLSGSVAARLIAVAGLGALGALAPQGTALAAAPYDDEFNSSTLDPKWSWVRQATGKWSLTAAPGSMQMTTVGDIWGTNNTAPVLLQTTPTSDFQISTSLSMSPTADNEQAGLVIYGDDNNYVRLTYGHLHGVLQFEITQEVNASDQWVDLAAPPGSSFYLKLVKTAANYTGYYSTDGSTWTQVGQENNVHITAGKMGLLSLQGGAFASVPANFDFFHADLLPSCQIPNGNDEFSSTTLDPKWYWVRQHVGKWSLSANPGYLQITTENDDIWQNTNNAPVLLQAAPSSDFDISTKISMSPNPTMDYQQGGLVIYGNDDNYVRLTFGYFKVGSYGTGFEFGKEVAAVYQSTDVAAPTNASTFYLRIVKSGQTYTGYSSQDGTSWSLVGQYSNLTFPVNNVGLSAFNGYGVTPTPTSISTNFDFFHVRAPACQTTPAVSSAYPPLLNALNSADPVQTFTGNYSYAHTDLAIAGRGPSPVFTRSYNSTDPRVGPLGPGWTDNDSVYLTDPGDGSSDVVLVGPQGRSDRYTHNSDGSYTPPAGVYTTLVKNSDGSYRATMKDQSIWTFNADGQLTQLADRYGNASSLSYNANGQLVAVSDPAGRGSLSFSYDPTSSLLLSVSDWLTPTRTVQFGYDASGRLQTVTDRDGKTTTYAYDGTSSRLATITDANHHTVISNTYDPTTGKVTAQKDAYGVTSGQQTTFSYVPNGDGTETTTVTAPTTTFDGFGPQTIDTYNTQGQLTQRVAKPSSTASYSQSFTYDAKGNLNTTTDARGNQTTFCYDLDYTGASIAGSAGNLTRKIDSPPTSGADVPVTLYKYDGKNNLTEVIPPKGVASGTAASCTTNLSSLINLNDATDNAYDANGVSLLSVTRKYTDPDLGLQTAVTKFEYNDAANPGLVTRAIPPRGNTGPTPDYSYATTFAYGTSGTQAGMLLTTTDALNNTTAYTYDAVGRKLSLVDPNGNVSGGTPAAHTWSFTYDNEDRPLTTSAPAPTAGGTALVTTFTYDPVGNQTAVRDANGQYTQYVYDARNSLQEVDESPLAWTMFGSPPATVDKTDYTYDNLGNLQRVTRASGDATNERATDYAYDGFGRLRKETQYPSWPTTTPTLVTTDTYDGNGNRLTLVDPLGQTTTDGYDALNRLTSISYSDGTTPNVTYAYDANGNRASLTDGTSTTSYAYDEMDRLLSVTSPVSQTVGYRYDLDGNRTRVIYPDSTAVTYTYDKASQLTSLQDWANRSVSYQYFPDSSLETVTNPNGTTATFAYDNALRLSQVTNLHGSSTISQHTYTLDNVGNRSQVAETLAQVGGGTVSNTTTYTYDWLYRLTGDGTRSYGYDPVGNRTSLTQGATTTYTYDKADRILSAGATTDTVDANGNETTRGSDSFLYDQANRLTLSAVGGITTTYAYDGDGNRVSQTTGITTTNYLYDVNSSLPNVLADGTYTYVYGVGLAYAVDSSGNLQVEHSDGLGSVRAISDNAGNVIQTYQTDPFGVPTQVQGTSTQPFQFTGQQRDAGSMLYYLRARYYDPTTGRFLTRDPLAGDSVSPQSLNRYAYAQNNPTTFLDPSGYASCRDFLCAVVGTAVAGAEWLASPEGFNAVASAIGIAKTFQDPNAGLKEKLVNAGILLLGRIDPVGVSAEPEGTPRFTMVSTSNGSVVPVPEGWQPRVADNGRGLVYQRPGAAGNADTIRIMDPTPLYPEGYVRYYNGSGQPLDSTGRPGNRAATHIRLDYQGPIPRWPQ